MQLRVARHTQNLPRIIAFYENVFGLERLGDFNDHDGYDGVFLGFRDAHWHLEFTTSEHAAGSSPGEDDLLVLYYSSREEINAIAQAAKLAECLPLPARNPYWNKNGICLADPEGHRVVLAYQQAALKALDPLTAIAREKNLRDWDALCHYVRRLPYGRNKNRHELSLVISEQRGSCSSKHAYLKAVADRNGIRHVDLLIVLYRMNRQNTPGIGSVLEQSGVPWVPEAHCVLKVNGAILDFTGPNSSFERIKADAIELQTIEPHQVAEYKVNYHKKFFKEWALAYHPELHFNDLWALRERCIDALGAGAMHE